MIPPYSVMLVDDHPLVREGVKTLLETHPEFAIIAEAASAKEAVALAARLKPDIVIMDIKMVGNGGITACREIVTRRPETKVIVLTAYSDDEMLFEAIRAGASGYILKDISGELLLRALLDLTQGANVLDPSLTQRVFAKLRAWTRGANGAAALPPGELVNFLDDHFNRAELNDLCARLGVDPEEIEGETRRERSTGIVGYFRRHGRLPELVRLVGELRPNFKGREDNPK